MQVEFTGEYYVPGKTDKRIEEDHVARYSFAAAFAKGCDVLDVACGEGYGSTHLISGGAARYLGIDINRELVAFAHSKYKTPVSDFVYGSITELDYTEEFSLVTCFETIEHVSEYRLALKCLYKALKPGGKLLISSPNRPVTSPDARQINDTPHNPFHTQEFTAEELINELRSTGFRCSDTSVYGQRLRYITRPLLLRRILNKLMGNPDQHSSPQVRPLSKGTARYFLIVAQK